MMKRTLLFVLVAQMFVGCGYFKLKDQPISPVEITEDEIASDGDIEFIEKGAKVYRATESVYTDLIHTKLEVNFDWEKSRMNGKAFITAKPHFYPSDSLILDAKGMDILSVKMDGKDLTYTYASDFLKIKLGKTFTRAEKYTIEITYTAKPDERVTEGSAAITSDKGLYFINPRGEEKGKMPQIWTQGETEASSVWFPTIDAPNVKTTQEIYMTVDAKYATLSNGKLVSSKKNPDGTRTDHWKQDLPHAPYLFMMAVGEFKVINDSYTKKDGSKMEVSYYVEPEWEQYARDIFGETPNMIRFFSDLLKVEYPWDKYNQIIVRDYVSGAMENTGAVIFGDFVYKTKRELIDGNDHSIIAHELFHHWFGDLVTAESWSNLTLNESFANYSQYLWDEHKFGLDEADYQASLEEEGYYQSAQMSGYHDLVWFSYEDKEQMFDGHSYNKGGRILHMLRNYLGDEAFFESLTLYLKTNQYKAAEFQQLRLAFEEVCGEDLNWFFEQWYLSSGHPILAVNETVNAQNQTVNLAVQQNQDLKEFPVFTLPVDVAVYDSNGKTTHRIVINQQTQSFDLPYVGTLKCVIFDEQKMLLAQVLETKPTEQWVFQYYNSNRYKAREQSLVEGVEMDNLASNQMVLDALNDEFWNLRVQAIEKVSLLTDEYKPIALKVIKNLSVNDAVSQVRAAALAYISKVDESVDVTEIMQTAIAGDQSYLVIGTALKALSQIEPDMAMVSARKLEKDPSMKLRSTIAQIYGNHGGEGKADFFFDLLNNPNLSGFDQLGSFNSFTLFNSRMSTEQIEKSIPTYKYMAENGGYYTKMFFGQNLDYLKGSLTERITELTRLLELDEKAKDFALADQKRKEIQKVKNLQNEFDKIQVKEN